MNKTLLKNFATQARVRLMKDVAYRLGLMGITAKGIQSPTVRQPGMEGYEYAKGEQFKLFGADIDARRHLAEEARAKGFDQLVEEVAYTWFNRLIAIRFMEVNDYLPTHTRALSSLTAGQTVPDMVTYALDIDLGLTDKEKELLVTWKLDSQVDELFRFLFLKQCDQLAGILPDLFETRKTSGLTSAGEDPYRLLLTISCVDRDGVVGRLLDIPEDYFNVSAVDEEGQPIGQVEIIGWMYQYYISDKHDQIINIYKGTVAKEDIPAATQLFTTEWVVKYMVENSLGRAWLDSHPNDALAAKWKYLMRVPDGNGVAQAFSITSPEELSFFDPCMGSGHILVYAFDVLMDIYQSAGYTSRDAAQLIVQKNLHGLDIDKRAAQLAYFAVMMKARQYDRRFFSRDIRPQVYEIVESNALESLPIRQGQLNLSSQSLLLLNSLIERFRDAKQYGSLLHVDDMNLQGVHLLQRDLGQVSLDDLMLSSWLEASSALLPQLIAQAAVLAKKYHAVVTNPPYMNKYNPQLKAFMQSEYKDYGADLFSAFIYRNFDFCVKGGYSAFMTPFVWMFIKSYEKLRNYIINDKHIATLVQMEYSAFEEATVPICTFVLKNATSKGRGRYIRLTDFRGGMAVQDEKLLYAQLNTLCDYSYEADQYNFAKIPGAPVAYWVRDRIISTFENNKQLSDYAQPRTGIMTGDNNRFLRLWWEISFIYLALSANTAQEAISSRRKWFPYNKGGDFRKWYGNNDFVVNWFDGGYEVFALAQRDKRNSQDYPEKFKFKESISWSLVTSGVPAFRLKSHNLSDIAGPSLFPEKDILLFMLSFCNSCITTNFLFILNPTINFQGGNIGNLPFRLENKKTTDLITEKTIDFSKHDWDSFETSWDFKRHPMVETMR